MASQRSAGFPNDYPSSGHRGGLDHTELNAPQYQSSVPQIPGSLQPGRAGSGPSASQINPQNHRSSPPNGKMAVDFSQIHSRSSPVGLDSNGYSPFTPIIPARKDSSQYNSPTNQKHMAQISQQTFSNTPLGLADIRPRADSRVSESLSGFNPSSHNDTSAVPNNSNYLAPWALYAFDWCKWPAQSCDASKVALGSYLEDGQNFIQVLDSHFTPTSSESYSSEAPKFGLNFVKIAEATHSYPVTRLLWEPPSSQKQSIDLLATSGDHLRLWSLPSETQIPSHNNSVNKSMNHNRDLPMVKLSPLALLSNSKTPEHTAPLTSLDWNTISPSLIITSSIDTTCTIWDIPTLTAKTQLIAHDKEVFDVRFCAKSVDVFVSCGADGSVRMFDLRSLEHSTIIYEPTAKDDKDSSFGAGKVSPTLAQQTMLHAPPLLRLATSPHDTHLLATFSQDSNVIRILDVRQPGQALLELKGHSGAINCIEWSPTRRGTLASGADDSLVLIWDLFNQHSALLAPSSNSNSSHAVDNAQRLIACWKCDYEVGNISWAPQNSFPQDAGEWLGVSGGRGIWGVKL